MLKLSLTLYIFSVTGSVAGLFLTVVTSNVKERMDNIWEAIDKPLIKVSESKKHLYVHFIL